MVGSQLEKFLGRLLPRKLTETKESLFQALLIAAVILVAMTTAFATGLLLIIFLNDPSGYVTFIFGLTMLALLGALKLGLAPSQSFIILEFSTGLHFLLCRAMQDRIDWPLAMWLTIFPILRLLYGGFRQGLYGVAYTSILALCMYALEFYSPFARVPILTFISFERGVSFTVAIFIITAVFNSLRMDARERAEQAARARTLFLANMSHELRTPMNGVIGITELLLGNNLTKDMRTQLELVHRSGTQMVLLINDILDLTRLESSKLKLESLPTDIRSILDDVISLQKHSLGQKKLTLHVEIDNAIPKSCLSDGLRLKQILINLTRNAVKFTNEGSVILKAMKVDRKIRFEVVDTGIGIPFDVQEKLFSPFEQADLSFTRRYGGSGLGLAISQRLVSLFGGSLKVFSEEGIGSNFSFEIDCVASDEFLPSSPPTSDHTQTNQDLNLRVLVVEDNEVNKLVVLGMLKRCGCATESKSNGKESIEAVSHGNFDLVLMDCHMPVMDGFEATRCIRNLETSASMVPIVALTASAMAEDIEACISSGMNAVLTKPLSLIELRKMLHSIKYSI
jgi:signal transduction histidine kinase/CheY-like chemotaxis protein